MFSWHSIPFSRVVIPLCVGICLAYYNKFNLYVLLTINAILLTLIWLFPLILKLRLQYNWRIFKGAVLTFSMLNIGIVSTSLNLYHLPKHHYSNFKAVNLVVKIIEIKKNDTLKTTAIAEVIALKDSSNRFSTCVGLIYISAFKHKTQTPELKINATYWVKNLARYPDTATTPWSFDFKHYLKLNKIEKVLYSDLKNFKPVEAPSTSIRTIAENAKQTCLKILRTALGKPEFYGIAEGLLIGYRDDIDPEVARGFTNTGTIHILSTSGMHVALIFSLLHFLTRWLKKTKNLRILQFIFILACLWLYAFITGLGPSIVRACITLTITGLGQLLDRKTNTINLVLATAFFQLIIHPLELFHPAFQLSYSAVLGILTLHPLISERWQPTNKWLTPVRDLISVSLAAQIFTFPITSYYFGNFPTLFLIANLLLIPISTGILYLSISTLIVCQIPILNTAIISLLKMAIQLNNYIAVNLGNWEYANLQGWHISLLNASLLGSFIVLTTAAFSYQSKTFLKLTILNLTLLCLSVRAEKQDIIVSNTKIFHENKKHIIYLIKGEQAYIVINCKGLTTKVNFKELELKIKTKLGIRDIQIINGQKLFVSTNLKIEPGKALQFFDNLMTLKK